MRLQRCIILFFPLLFISSYAQQAHKDSIEFLIEIADAFTGRIVEDGRAEILTPDSTLVCTGSWTYNTEDGVRTKSFIGGRVPQNGKYLLHVTHTDYFPKFVPVTISLSKRSMANVVFLPPVTMRKRPKDVQLGEAVVKATKIKMVMKGDTIVYNADAFQLSQGSMLDALIEQLPGAELKDNGVITVNGRVISSLYVNGRDFFRGDPKVALENLPGYMVDKVKVFEESTFYERVTGEKQAERPIVMDVRLKKQYSVGWIANAEAAHGTERCYLGRLFAMRFTDCSRLALYGSINNTNDTRRPGAKGDWTPAYLPSGLQTTRTAGLEYSYQNRAKTFDWTSSVNAGHWDNHTLTTTGSEKFLPNDRAFNLERRDKRHCSAFFNTDHYFKREKEDVQQNGGFYLKYDKSSGRMAYQAAEFAEDPYLRITAGILDSIFMPGNTTLLSIARNRRSQEVRDNGENWSVRMPYSIVAYPFLSKGIYDSFSADAHISYDKHQSHEFLNDRLDYLASASSAPDNRNQYRTASSRHYSYGMTGNYRIGLIPRANFYGSLAYSYDHDYRSGRADLFRLDRLDGWDAEDEEHPLGTLPSGNTEMHQALDIQNSEHSQRRLRKHLVTPSLSYQHNRKERGRTDISLEMPVAISFEHLRYDRAQRHYDLHRSKALTGAGGSLLHQVITKDRVVRQFILSYNMTGQQPALLNSIELVNDANPLYIQYGNADLKVSTTHLLTFRLSKTRKFRRLYDLNLSYQRIHDAFATERTYNSQTGGYFVRPVNVNGNWRTDGSISLNRQLGKRKDFTWSNNTSYSFDHNVDMANVDGAAANSLSTIKNLYLREQFSVNYSRNGWNLGARLRGSYNRLTGDRSDFSAISAWDYNYGFSARIPLPWQIGLSTDFTVFSRRGYDGPGLNTDNFVWNARVERSILNGNLTFIIDGFDLLHDLSSVTRTVNAQGRIESYSNVIPSYFMARVVYRLNVQPKKRD